MVQAGRKTLWSPAEKRTVVAALVDIEERSLKSKAKYPTQLEMLTEAQMKAFGADMTRWRSMSNSGDLFKVLKDELNAERLKRKPVEPPKPLANPGGKAAPAAAQPAYKPTPGDGSTVLLSVSADAVRELLTGVGDMAIAAFGNRLAHVIADTITSVCTNIVPPLVAQGVERELHKLKQEYEIVQGAMVSMFEKQDHRLHDIVRKAVIEVLDAPVKDAAEHLGIVAHVEGGDVVIERPSSLPADSGIHEARPPRDRPKVCVIGLMPTQEQDVLREFGEAMTFTFIQPSASSGGKRLADKLSGNDLIVIMERTGAWSRPDVKNSGVPFVMSPGAVSGLKNYLQLWFNGRQGAGNESPTQRP